MNCICCNKWMRRLVYDLWICDDCGHISCGGSPEISLYDRSYMIKYKRYEKSKVGRYLNKCRIELVNKYVILHRPMLDFGCGYGTFVRSYEGATGFDINPYSPFCEIESLFGDYDVLTFWDSLEHLSHPEDIIKGINPNWVFGSIPYTNNLEKLGSRDTWDDWKHYYQPPEHVQFFSEHSLETFFNECGYHKLEHNFNEEKYRLDIMSFAYQKSN